MASLSSSLLARKGQARPAMRPQGFVGLSPGTTQDDLGWNDMGEEPAPAPAKPEVLRQIEALDEKIAQAAAPAPAPEVEPEPEPVAARKPAARAAKPAADKADKKAKFAFTLRLDNDRHLRLRLASALTNRSAQQLVCQALDAFLESQTEVEALARQVDPAKDHG
ncbi:MAG: hypothetical protein ABWY47_09460 [Xanthobacteraceae bacterium]